MAADGSDQASLRILDQNWIRTGADWRQSNLHRTSRHTARSFYLLHLWFLRRWPGGLVLNSSLWGFQRRYQTSSHYFPWWMKSSVCVCVCVSVCGGGGGERERAGCPDLMFC